MNAPNSFPGKHSQVLAKSPDPIGGAGSPANASNLITADASKVSPRAFLDFVTGSSPEMRAERRRQDQERCIRAIANGDTYGFPPMMVDECKRLMASDGSTWMRAEAAALRRQA